MPRRKSPDVTVEVIPPTQRGILELTIDEGNELVRLVNIDPSDDQYCTNVVVEGALIMWITEDGRILERMLLLWKWSLWTVRESYSAVHEPFGPIALPVIAGSLRVTPRTVKHQTFEDMDLKALTNESRDRLWITIGYSREPVQPVTLSERCVAYLEGDRLRGFFVQLG